MTQTVEVAKVLHLPDLNPKLWGYAVPEKGKWVKLRMKFYFPNRNHPDPSNTLKVFLDALEGEIYENDKWVLVDLLKPEFDKENPRTEIEVEILK